MWLHNTINLTHQPSGRWKQRCHPGVHINDISSLVEIKGNICKLFPPPVHLAPRWGGSAWNFVTAIGLRKLEWRPFQTVINDNISIRLHIVPALDRQTDRRTELIKQYRTSDVNKGMTVSWDSNCLIFISLLFIIS